MSSSSSEAANATADFTPELIAELQSIMIASSVSELIHLLKKTSAHQSAEEAIRKLLDPSKKLTSAQEIIALDGVPVICDAMKRFKSAVFVRRLGCAICMNLGSHSEELRMRVVAGGAISAIKGVLEDFYQENIELMCVALGVLNSFSTTDGAKAVIAQEQIVLLLVKILNSLAGSSSVDVQLRALTILANCCHNHGGNQEQLRASNGLVAVLSRLLLDENTNDNNCSHSTLPPIFPNSTATTPRTGSPAITSSSPSSNLSPNGNGILRSRSGTPSTSALGNVSMSPAASSSAQTSPEKTSLSVSKVIISPSTSSGGAHNESIALKAAAVLDAISAPKVKEAMLEADAVNILFRAMAKYPTNSQLQLNCLGTIRSLASMQPEKMLSSGVFEKMKSIMMSNITDTEVVEQCLAFVCGLALQDAHKDAVVDAGGLSVIKEAMSAHSSSAPIQHWGCRSLQILAFRKENLKQRLVDEKFLPLIYLALKTHSRDESVQEQGLAALTTLAANKTIKRIIVADGGLDLALKAKELNAGNEVIQKGASNLQIQLQFSDRY